jgi:hypothetical protein
MLVCLVLGGCMAGAGCPSRHPLARDWDFEDEGVDCTNEMRSPRDPRQPLDRARFQVGPVLAYYGRQKRLRRLSPPPSTWRFSFL